MTDRFLSAKAKSLELEQVAIRRNLIGYHDGDELNLVGLACSGGGIRAAAFAIGAMQCLSDLKPEPQSPHTPQTCFERIDYISSVSGGSYAACALAAAIIRDRIRLPFASSSKIGTPPPLVYIRAHAKLINSRGWLDYFEIVGIWLYSFVTGLLIVFPFLLVAAAILIVVFPQAGVESRLEAYVAHYRTILLWMLVFFSATYIIFATSYSYSRLRSLALIIGRYWPYLLLYAFIILFISVIPLILNANLPGGYIYVRLKNSFLGFLVGTQEVVFVGLMLFILALILIPLLIRQQELVVKKTNRISAAILAAVVRILLVITGVMAPLFLLATVLMLARWGILVIGSIHAAPELINTLGQWVSVILGGLFGAISFFGLNLDIFSDIGIGVPAYNYAIMYIVLAVGLFIFTKYGLDTNWTSFHRFYRDRLYSSFISSGSERPDVISPRISDLPAKLSPYVLVNCTVNCTNSNEGITRPVDEPFVIGPKLVGNETIGFANTDQFENAAGEFFDLASIAAISGAAFSPIMGRYTSRSFRMFMSLLAFRLGYWVPNPKTGDFQKTDKPSGRRVGALYYLKEMIGATDASSPFVYLTDGGHVDNSGIYELLRRRCATIIAIDSEADVDSLFDNISYLVEFAQARLDTRIILSCHKVGTEGGVHCAIGRIFYPATKSESSREGYLVYCKLSLTGDENLDLLSRRRASGEFPYHSTLNQNYDELMFDAYRYLGIHIVNGLITQRDNVEFWDGRVRPLKPCELSEELRIYG